MPTLRPVHLLERDHERLSVFLHRGKANVRTLKRAQILLKLDAGDVATKQYEVESLVRPALPFGRTPEHRSFGAGYIDLPVPVHAAILEAVLGSLAAQGFQRILIWRGCGSHDLHEVVERFNAQRQWHAHAFLPTWPYHDLWCRLAEAQVAGGHADSFTISIMLYLRPEAVRRCPHCIAKHALGGASTKFMRLMGHRRCRVVCVGGDGASGPRQRGADAHSTSWSPPRLPRRSAPRSRSAGL